MSVHTKKITDLIARTLPPPAAKLKNPTASSLPPEKLKGRAVRASSAPTVYIIHWCPKTPGFGVRITAAGTRAWVAERRVDGKPTRRTLGAVLGAAAITAHAARALHRKISGELEGGTDRLVVKRARIAAEKVEAVTFADALKTYVKTKRRGKDGLALKARTVADYLDMLAQAGVTKTGRATQCGLLHAIADRPLHKITSDHIRGLHGALEARGERQQTYAMQVLRAVLRHQGVAIADNPLAPTTAGAKLVVLAPSRGNPSPIPPERLGGWWRAAGAITSASADMLRFMLLTGIRPGEAAGLLVGDVDEDGMRAVFRDTKNRSDHTVVLSTQAAAIASWQSQGKKPKDAVFGIADAGKTLATINAAAGTPKVSQKTMRSTFASIAAERVPAFTLRKLLNHSSTGDVAATHYVGVSQAQLRAAWQTVADAIESAK